MYSDIVKLNKKINFYNKVRNSILFTYIFMILLEFIIVGICKFFKVNIMTKGFISFNLLMLFVVFPLYCDFIITKIRIHKYNKADFVIEKLYGNEIKYEYKNKLKIFALNKIFCIFAIINFIFVIAYIIIKKIPWN